MEKLIKKIEEEIENLKHIDWDYALEQHGYIKGLQRAIETIRSCKTCANCEHKDCKHWNAYPVKESE